MNQSRIERTYKVCARCIMDTSDPEISFDSNGNCSHCTAALVRLKAQLLPKDEREQALARLVERIKTDGAGKEYDCIIGVSGGVDSTTVAYRVKHLGLRPLAVHFDNGWDSELAVDNIKRALDALKIELYTYVVDWEEFRDLQLAFLRASVANCEAPTDHGITALLFHTANKMGVRYILSGSNLVTEAIMPVTWSHYNQDLRHMKALNRRFGGRHLETLPTISIPEYLFYVLVKGIRQVPFLNYFDYDKETAKALLTEQIGWRDYGAKHWESVWTRYFQGYYLPTKFGFDKRRAHYSSMVCAGAMTREQALLELAKPAYPAELLRQDTQFVLKKFGLSEDELDRILRTPGKPATAYPSHNFLFHTLRPVKNIFRAIATRA